MILEIAGVMCAPAIRIYKSCLTPQDYDDIMEAIFVSRLNIEQMKGPRNINMEYKIIRSMGPSNIIHGRLTEDEITYLQGVAKDTQTARNNVGYDLAGKYLKTH